MKSQQQFEKHLEVSACMIFIGDPVDGLYEDTIKALKRLKPNRKGKVESWDIYQVLFPEDLT